MRDFEHQHAAHCESGTVAALLRHQGLNLSEPMVFGIGGGLFFLHLSFVKMGGIPLTSYRDAPRVIIKNMEKRLGVRWRQYRYRSADLAMRALDASNDRSRIATMSQPGKVATARGMAPAWHRVAGCAGGRNAISPMDVCNVLGDSDDPVRTTRRREDSPPPVAGTAGEELVEKVAARSWAGSTSVRSQLVRFAVTTQQPSWLAARASGSPPMGNIP